MRLALESLPVSPVLLLSDSQAAFSVVCNAVTCGWARTADLKAVVDIIGEWDNRGVPVHLAWVKAHVGVAGNERADEMAQEGCRPDGDPQVTEGGVRALWKRLKAGQRRVVGLGVGRTTQWEWRALSRYVQARTEKGDLGFWRRRLGRGMARAVSAGMVWWRQGTTWSMSARGHGAWWVGSGGGGSTWMIVPNEHMSTRRAGRSWGVTGCRISSTG